MGITEVLFWFLTALAILSALMVVFSKNPVHSVLWLIAVFFAISGHYIILNAQFLAIVNLIVYAGAIMVLFLFVIMLMNLNSDIEPQKNRWMKMAGVIAGLSLMLVIIAALRDTDLKYQSAQVKNGDIGLIQNLGMVLFKDYKQCAFFKRYGRSGCNREKRIIIAGYACLPAGRDYGLRIESVMRNPQSVIIKICRSIITYSWPLRCSVLVLWAY
jgi:NADH-quinone oxidoreductase subunit J